jgi:hypothetical protein
MSKKKSFGLTKDTGSRVCQRCGLYFEPERTGQKVCHDCKKVRVKGYRVDGGEYRVSDTDRAVGYLLGFIVILIILIGIGNL